MTGLDQLFPRVLEYLNDPGKSIANITSPEMDGIKYIDSVRVGVCNYISYYCAMIELVWPLKKGNLKGKL